MSVLLERVLTSCQLYGQSVRTAGMNGLLKEIGSRRQDRMNLVVSLKGRDKTFVSHVSYGAICNVWIIYVYIEIYLYVIAWDAWCYFCSNYITRKFSLNFIIDSFFVLSASKPTLVMLCVSR